jgi:hypothetical protein
LQEGEQSSGAGKSKCHGTEFTKELVPGLDRSALPGGWEFGVEEVIEPIRAALREPEGHVTGVQEPAKDLLGGGPRSIALLKFLQGDGSFAGWGVQGLSRAKD